MLRAVSRFVLSLPPSHNLDRVTYIVATYREAHNLPSLQTFVIDVISADSEKLDYSDIELLKRTKMSSTFIREWIVERMKKEEEEDH